MDQTQGKTMRFKEAQSDEDFDLARILFRDYAYELDIDLSFQDFETELRQIHLQYTRPGGILMIAYTDHGQVVGCFGIRKIDQESCELKRMYLENKYRGQGLGTELMREAIQRGKELGYHTMKLDTLPTMTAAIGLYRHFGFQEIEPYRYNPIEGAIYFEKKLV